MAITRLGGANAITGTIPNSVLAAGNVIQVVQTVNTLQLLQLFYSYCYTGNCINITPSQLSSKIFIANFGVLT